MKSRDLLRFSTPYLSLLAVLLATGCNPLQSPQPETTSLASTSVTIDPQSLGLKHGDSWNFAAAVSNANDQTVIWSVQESSSGGMVSDTGVYTAPTTEGVYHVIATSKADPTKSAAATVAVGDTGFSLTGTLGNARFGHTATLLPNGKVYIAGGAVPTTDPNIDDGVDLLGTAELFDPSAGTFQAAGKLVRDDHTATLLLNGDVLFTGGIVGDTETQGIILTETAELLKDESGTLQPTGSMAFARYFHVATLLQDGRVLITGGYVRSATEQTLTKSAELYDPASGVFTPVGDMGAARAGHSATLLPNGEVLITGGGIADAEVFDPATNSFTSTGSASSKWVSTATLLTHGRVLITGEETADGSAPAASELYDPATGKFTPTGTMSKLRSGYTATLLPDGTVLIAGGAVQIAGSTPGTYDEIPVTTTEIYNPTTGSFSPGPTMRQGRIDNTATPLPDGSVLFVGGLGKGISSAPYAPLASAEAYR